MRRPRLSCGLLEATRLKNEGIIMDSLAVMRPRRCQQLQVVLRREQSSYTSEAVTARQPGVVPVREGESAMAKCEAEGRKGDDA